MERFLKISPVLNTVIVYNFGGFFERGTSKALWLADLVSCGCVRSEKKLKAEDNCGFFSKENIKRQFCCVIRSFDLICLRTLWINVAESLKFSKVIF